MSERIQRQRTKGWRMPPGAMYVGRPTKWGNPYTLEAMRGYYPESSDAELRRMCVSDFEGLVDGRWARLDPSDVPYYPEVGEIVHRLGGHDLACWCPLDQPCHADVLLRLANRQAD